ncbi:hypothetical protein Tco_0575639 [Tanacetum coccineum]
MLKKSIATSYLIDAKIDYDSINELSRKIFVELQYNTFGRMEEEDVLGHISNFLRILDLIKIMIFDTDRLHLNIFPLSLTKAARVWWSSNEYSKITAWGILTERFFCNYFPLSLDGKNYGSNNHKDDEHGYYELMAWIDSKHDNKGISSKNFHELDYNVLVKLQECWWKINAHEVAPFTRMESYGQRLYANFKTEKVHDPYLDINHIFGRNYDLSNAGNTQDNQGHEKRRDDSTHEPSVCKIRRFEMMKYSFKSDEEYIAIKESEYLNHSKDNLNVYRELLRIIKEGWVVATTDDE